MAISNTPGRFVDAAKNALAKPKAPPKPKGNPALKGKPKVAPKPKTAPSPTGTTPATGMYASAFNQLNADEQRAHDVAARRLSANEKLAQWVAGEQGKINAAGVQADNDAARKQATVQLITGAAQAGVHSRLDQIDAARQGSVTSGPGATRAGLVADQLATHGRLANAQNRQLTETRTGQQQAGFLAAANAATAAASAARIRGESAQDIDKIRGARTDLSIRKEDATLAAAQAADEARARVAAAQIEADTRAAEFSARMADNAADRDLRIGLAESDREFRRGENAADRRVRLKTAARSGKNGERYVSDAEVRQRGNSAAMLKDEAAKATAIARKAVGSKIATGPRAGQKYGGDDVRAAIMDTYPEISIEALELAIDAAFGKQITPARRKKNRAKFNAELKRRSMGR